mgnify:CR=1 FL=1
MIKENKRQVLCDALERLKAGKPERIDIKRKISPSTVEEEAGVSKSLLRNNPEYHDIFIEVTEIKKNLIEENLKQKNLKKGNTPSNSSKNLEVVELRKALTKANEKCKKLKIRSKVLIQANTELTLLLTKKVNDSNLAKLAESLRSMTGKR